MAYPYTAEHWRNRAEEVRAMAAKTSDPVVRTDLLAIAESYELLAKMAEQKGVSQ